eukprot:gene19542-19977_t
MTFPILIVGAGQAGAQAVQSLRQGGYQGALTLVGNEPHLPYQRPPLSKKYLTGETDEERLLLRPAAMYRDLDVDVRLGVAATQLDTTRHRVRLADGTVLPYSKLLIATGMRARPLAIPGIDLPGVVTLRSMLDAARIRRDLDPSNRVVVIGGGYIGLEVAAIARGMGLQVTVLEAAGRVLGRVVAPEVSRYFTKLHLDHGLDLRVATGVIAVEGEGRAEAVVLADGTRVPADLVLLSIGAIPDTALAEAAGARPMLALQAANNETGVLQPVAEAARLVHDVGGLLVCDAVQMAGRLPLDAVADADALLLSAHKLGGPKGVGALAF